MTLHLAEPFTHDTTRKQLCHYYVIIIRYSNSYHSIVWHEYNNIPNGFGTFALTSKQKESSMQTIV